ncbi:MAG: SPFH domain-containing protein [Veillonella sp.]|nr:SPFH domain-containing protein [Veillonella sp.]
MSEVRVIQCNAGNATLVWKYPFPKIIRGSVITVHQNQVACIYVNGVRMYTLEPGRNIVVDSAQLPYLNNALCTAAGGQQIYSFEVWYANMTCEHNIDWSINGESDGVYIVDSSIGAPLKLNASGQYRFKIYNAGLLMDKLVGTQTQYVATQVLKFLESQIKCLIIDIIMNVSKERQLTIQQILTQRREFNTILQLALNEELKHIYGLEITDFSIGQLSSSDYDAYLRHQRTGLGMRAEFAAQGEYYQKERNYQVLNNAALNPTVGTAVGAGIGIGVGNAIGQQIGAVAQDTVLGNSTPPPLEDAPTWHYAMNGRPSSPVSDSMVKDLISQNVILCDTKLWKPGLASWMPANQIPEFANLFMPPLE